MLERLAIVLLVVSGGNARLAAADRLVDRPRLLVLTDIGGDPDDQQSRIRLLVHSNEFEIEGLIASASGAVIELQLKDAPTP